MALDNFRTIELIWDKANKSIIKTIKTASSDTTGRYLSVKVLNRGQEVTLNDAQLKLYWEHPNFNTSGIDDFETMNNGGLFKMTFSDEMLTNIGELNAYLVLTLSDGKITSDSFPIKVFKGADDGAVIPTNGRSLVKQIDRKIDKGNVTLGDLTQEVKLAMTGGSVPVVGENSVGTENIKDNSVTFKKTDFAKLKDNIFEGWDDRFYLNGDEVTLTYNPTNTDYFGTILPIEPNTNYQIALEDGFSGLFKFGTDSRTGFTGNQNLNGAVKKVSASGLIETVFSFTSGSSDTYLYISSDADIAMNVSKIPNVRGRSVETLMPVEFERITLTGIEGVGIKNDSIPIGKLERNTSDNVFNYRTTTAGYYVDRYTGNLVTNSDNSVSDYIPIKAGEYELTFDKVTVGNINYAFYKNRNFIEGGQVLVTDLTTPKTVPINTLADEFRFSIAHANNLKKYRVEFGETLSQSSEYYNYPKGLVMPKFDSNEPEIRLTENKAVITMGDTSYTIEHEVTPYTDGGFYQNKDTWRIVDCTVNGLKAYQSGAWETAIQVEGLPDFMGTFHGYEGTDSIGFYVDNKKITAGNFNANEILIVVRGRLFRHGTLDDTVATFTRLYMFKDGELKLTQKFNWLAEFELRNAYLAMQPIKRTVNNDGTGSNITTTVLTDLDYKEYDISYINSSLPIRNYVNGVKFAQIWGKDVGASITVETEDGDVDIYLWQAPQYNKIYFTYKRNSHIAIGDKWNFVTTYKVK